MTVAKCRSRNTFQTRNVWPHLRSMTITALDTGMRRGEMLALRFADVDMARGLIVLRGATTKSRKTRPVPISTSGCARSSSGSASTPKASKPDKALVFSNEIGDTWRAPSRI
jgi:integrase